MVHRTKQYVNEKFKDFLFLSLIKMKKPVILNRCGDYAHPYIFQYETNRAG